MGSYENSVKYRGTQRGHIGRALSKARERSKEKNLPIDIDLDYLCSIATDRCPAFGTVFDWGQKGDKKASPDGPSLDRVIPDLGYVKGNVVFISNQANKIKQDVTEKELYAVADWLHDKRKEVLNAFKGKLTSLPEPPSTPGRVYPAHGPVHGTRSWQDCDGAHHNQREPGWEDPGDSPQASRRVGLVPRVPKMEAPIGLPSGARHGDARAAFERALQQLRSVRDQRGERGLARGTLAKWAVRLFSNRRIKQVQGPQHEKVQGDQKSPAVIQATPHSYGHSDTSGSW